jgi:DNA-binding GntR family transcriptional regulator
MSGTSGTIARSSATSQVLEKLRLDILMNAYPDGEQITEAMLAQRYRAARSSVRNALLVLERESLIAVEDNGTKRVRRFSESDANHLYDLRSYIELRAVERLFSLPRRNYAHALEALKNASLACQSRDVPKILRADTDFHCACVSLCGDKALMQAWIALSGITEAIFLLNMNDSAEYKEWYLQTFCLRHEALLAALMSDRGKSLALFSEHIEDARKITCGVIRAIAGCRLNQPEAI